MQCTFSDGDEGSVAERGVKKNKGAHFLPYRLFFHAETTVGSRS